MDVFLGTKEKDGSAASLFGADRRKHCAIFGKSGVGKTTLMRNMIVADIFSGNGLTVIDPHGGLIEDLLQAIPKSRTNDTHAHLGQTVTRETTEWGRRNTEFHYAFELIKVLARLNKKTFNLVAPPISGIAPESVVSYLRASTRCWLYGFHGASVALSRACLEETLKVRLPSTQTGADSLEVLIETARRVGVLDDYAVQLAHTIRRTGNKFLHGKAIDEKDSRNTLDAVRGVVEQVFTS